MRLPVVTAVTDARWEAELVQAFDRDELGIAVVRRCVDLAELLAAASSGTARAALLSADLRRLDRDALARLAVTGLAVVGLVPPGDEPSERRLRQLGVLHVLPADTAPAGIAAAVVAAVESVTTTAAPELERDDIERAAGEPDQPAGRVIAVWGPTGAPGRTTVAVTLAAELATVGTPTLLADADTYGGAVAQVLGLLDEAPGIAAATRLANNGTLDVPGLTELAREVLPGLVVLTGISRPDRWPELRPASLEVVLALARRVAAVTVVDCGFCLEQDEELAYDQTTPRRNGATLASLDAADDVVVVGGADPVSLQRLVRALSDLRELRPELEPLVVVNRVRPGVAPGDARREIAAALERYAGVAVAAFVPDDGAAFDAALAAGRTLVEAAPRSPARLALADLAGRLVGARTTPARRLFARRG